MRGTICRTHLGLLPCMYLLIVVFSIFCQGNNQAFNDQEKLLLPEDYKINWMEMIDDDKLITDITIPGTHDTMALYGGPAAECQSWQLEDQLKAGVRYLDLSVFAFDHTVYVMHGVMYEHTTILKVLETVQQFLSSFQTETVLISVKPESIEDGNVNDMVQKLLWNDENIWVGAAIPTMGEARGKIVFVQKNSFKIGIPLQSTDSEGDNEVTHIHDKENLIIKHLEMAKELCGMNSLVLSYSSGTGIGTIRGMFLTPKRVAEAIDPWLMEYLQHLRTENPKSCYGVIAMDYPGLSLIQTVIKFNEN